MTALALAIRAKTTLGLEQTEAFFSIHDALRVFMEYYAACLRRPLGWPLWICNPITP